MRADADRLARQLIPAQRAPSFFEPAGFEKLSFVMLSANLIATAALATMTVSRLTKLLGEDVRRLAQMGLSQLEHLFALFLPAGVSAIFTIVFFFLLLSLARGVGATWRFQVTRSGNVLLSHGGLFTRTECRVLLSCVTFSSIHLTPWARLLRRSPVFVSAGGFKGHELPLVTVRTGQEEETLRRLLPEFCLPTHKMCNLRRRHLGSFLIYSGTAAGLCLALMIVSIYALPGITWALAIGLFFALVWCAAQVDAFFREGICKNDNRTFSLSYSRGFTRYLVTLYTNDFSLELKMHPIAANEGRCDLRLFTPSHSTFKIRSIEYSAANHLRFNI